MYSIIAIVLALTGSAVQATESWTKSPFTYNNETFLLHGKPFLIRGGQMDPQRVPPAYWSDRIQKAKAMGLNTIFSYTFWNLIEPSPGQWDFTGRNDIAEWYRLVQEAGMYAVLRPGGYVCGERDWGGFPSWLMEVPDMQVRQNNKPFLDASRNYLNRLGSELRTSLINYGGPILMAQVENEYGFFGNDTAYKNNLADIMRGAFNVTLYTNDGGSDAVASGQIHGVLAATDGPPQAGFAARDQYVTDPTSLGPQLDGEYYTSGADTWGPNTTHSVPGEAGRDTLEQIYSDIDYILSQNASFSLYMFHGGTNFGFENGAIVDGNHTNFFTSSYDYGAPLDESGRTNDLYHGLRNLILRYVSPQERIPSVPRNLPRMKIPDVQLKAVSTLFDNDILGQPIQSQQPLRMEQVGQSYGFIMYEHEVSSAFEGLIKPGDQPRDRVIVFVNGHRIGVLGDYYDDPGQVQVTLRQGDLLQLLVENMGRIDIGTQLLDTGRGINGSVTIDGQSLEGWKIYPLPLKTIPSVQGQAHHGGWSRRPPHGQSSDTPVFYAGTFRTRCRSNDPTCDTFISIPSGTKGQVWVNGFNLGSYWIVGPQQSLYLPAPVLTQGWAENEIVVLELEPKAGNHMVARGIDTRVWANNPDLDIS